jgi:hypothetical protein
LLAALEYKVSSIYRAKQRRNDSLSLVRFRQARPFDKVGHITHGQVMGQGFHAQIAIGR